jgi:hypothetical protein
VIGTRRRREKEAGRKRIGSSIARGRVGGTAGGWEGVAGRQGSGSVTASVAIAVTVWVTPRGLLNRQDGELFNIVGPDVCILSIL